MFCALLSGILPCPTHERPFCLARSTREQRLVKCEVTKLRNKPSLAKLCYVHAAYPSETSRRPRYLCLSGSLHTAQHVKTGWFSQSLHCCHRSRRSSDIQTDATAKASEGVEDNSGEEEAFRLSQGWADPTPENIIALALTAVVLFALLRIGWELLLVAFAVTGAALKYSFVATVLIIAVLFLL